MTTFASTRFASRNTPSERSNREPGGRSRRAADGLDVVVEVIRTRFHDSAHRVEVAAEVGGEHLHRRLRQGDAQRVDGLGELLRAAVLEVVASHTRHDDMLEARRRAAPPPPVALGEGGVYGRPVVTLQKPQERVQTSPRIMNVAVPREKHSVRWGSQRLQTECSSRSRSMVFISRSDERLSFFSRIQSGRRWETCVKNESAAS